MKRLVLCSIGAATAFIAPASLGASPATTHVAVTLADRFEPPVGQNGKPYYKSRGVQVNGHLGEDWNGVGGGDSDLGDPIHAVADGVVVFAQRYGRGWGGVVIVRHAYLEGRETRLVDSLYGILLDYHVKLGERVRRGQAIGRMGNDGGRYNAHLHFEMRKDIRVGLWRESFPRDETVYLKPTEFIAAHAMGDPSSRIAQVPVNTFPASPPPVLAGPRHRTPALPVWRTGVAIRNRQLVTGNRSSAADILPSPRPAFRVSRFEEGRTERLD